jgi:1,4-dihydroxy-2-naphthoate octaprenyltransferase
MGLAWGFTPPVGLIDFIILVAASFSIINLSSAIGAQVNTLSDYSLDLKDDRKKYLVQAMDSFGQNRLKAVLVVEFLLTLILVSLFALVQAKPMLLLIWIVGISLGCSYSASPIRLKSRSWLAPISLILVLAVFPVLFAYYTFTPQISQLFLLSLAGLALTVYGVIIPTEIRDYFGDKAMNIETMTVRLGLVKASLLSIILLITGGILIWTAFFLEFAYGTYTLLSVVTLAIPIIVFIVFRKFNKLYFLSKKYMATNGDNSIGEEIVSFSAHNPQWIMLVTQTYSVMSIILLIEKLLV